MSMVQPLERWVREAEVTEEAEVTVVDAADEAEEKLMPSPNKSPSLNLP